MLQDVVQHGTGTRANIGRPAAGKTGTTDNYHDAWFVGYTPDLVAGVWIGNDDNTSMGVMSGGMAPAEMWKAFMQKVVAGTPAKNFDGVSYTAGSVSEIKDEKSAKDEKHTDKKEKNAKDAKNGKDARDVPRPEAGGRTMGDGAPQADSTPSQQPSLPEPGGGPEPGAGVSKGRD